VGGEFITAGLTLLTRCFVSTFFCSSRICSHNKAVFGIRLRPGSIMDFEESWRIFFYFRGIIGGLGFLKFV